MSSSPKGNERIRRYFVPEGDSSLNHPNIFHAYKIEFEMSSSPAERDNERIRRYVVPEGDSSLTHPHMFHTYMALCSDKSLYTGYCKHLSERENRHNQGTASKYTRTRRPVKMVYSEQFQNRSDAMKREAEIKKLTKAQKEALILAKKTE